MEDTSPTTFERRACADCEQLFTISPQELRWFEDRGMNPPRRCTRCRAERRRERERAEFDGRGLPRLTTRRF